MAGDIEMSWWGPSRSKAMVNGAKSIGHRGYVDFGTAGGCPPRPQGVRARHCFNGWSLGDVAHVSNAHGGRPLPEVYYRGGPRHFNQAAEWASVARAWNARHGSHYRFLGATGYQFGGRVFAQSANGSVTIDGNALGQSIAAGGGSSARGCAWR